MNKNLKFFIRPYDEAYGIEESTKIVEAFEKLNPDSKGGQLGAGASGLMPELNMSIIIPASLIAGGFLNAIGEDVYKIIKQGIKKLVKIKPKKKIASFPRDYIGKVYTHLIFWISFDDIRLLIQLDLKNENEVAKALELLPKIIEKILKSENVDFIKLFWNGKKWIE